MRRAIVLAALAFLAGASPSHGQTPFVRTQPTVTLAVSSVSSSVALGTDLTRVTTLWTCNKGPSDVNVFFGDSAVTAALTGTLIPSGICVNVSPDGKTFLAAITAAGTATLSITPGSGTMAAAGSGGGGGGGTSTNSGAITNPTSTLALPVTTTAYTAGWLICSSATVATCNTTLAATSFAIANAAGGAIISRLRLSTNDATATAWGAQTIQVDLWTAAPTFATTGDRASYNTDFATGSANHIGAYSCVMSAELADGAYAECAPTVGSAPMPKLASGTSIFWTLIATTGSGVTGASKTFTLTAELAN